MRLFLLTLPEKIVYALSILLSKWINKGKQLSDISVTSILCIKQDEIGDLCYSMHVFEMLKKQFPQASLTLLCKPFALSLTADHPCIDKRVTSYSELDKKRYDLIIDLRENRRSVFYALFNIPSYRLNRGTVRYTNKINGGHPHEVITNFQVVSPIISKQNEVLSPRLFYSNTTKHKIDSYINNQSLGRFAILHTGARKALRRWDKFGKIAEYLYHTYHLNIVFTGDASEQKDIEHLQQQIPFKTYSIAGVFNLNEFACMVSKAQIYIGNESGPLCIASISGTISIGLFGPGEPNVFYPWGKNTAYVHHVLECNPCDQIHCKYPNNTCMQRITVDEVTEKVRHLFSSASA
jgi:ADP-heptose:LPS heptosyltransferase